MKRNILNILLCLSILLALVSVSVLYSVLATYYIIKNTDIADKSTPVDVSENTLDSETDEYEGAADVADEPNVVEDDSESEVAVIDYAEPEYSNDGLLMNHRTAEELFYGEEFYQEQEIMERGNYYISSDAFKQALEEIGSVSKYGASVLGYTLDGDVPVFRYVLNNTDGTFDLREDDLKRGSVQITLYNEWSGIEAPVVVFTHGLPTWSKELAGSCALYLMTNDYECEYNLGEDSVTLYEEDGTVRLSDWKLYECISKESCDKYGVTWVDPDSLK